MAKREYSQQELAQKLKAFTEESDDIPALLDDFKQRGWLSDARFTEQLVHARKAKFGASKVAHELREKGVADELVADAVAQLKENELDNARDVWRKKFKAPPANREEWAKQARFMQSRGFSFETIKKILDSKKVLNSKFDDDN